MTPPPCAATYGPRHEHWLVLAAVVVLVQLRRVRVAQRAQCAGARDLAVKL